MKKCYVIKHVGFEDLGTLKDILDESHFNITYFQAGFDDIKKIDPNIPDLLVIMGGPISVYDDKKYLWLTDEIDLIRNRILLNKPILGICLGAQLIAKASGANVFSGGKKEIGWSSLKLTSDGSMHSLKLLADIPVFHWHGDTFDLPKNATLLASTDIYANQAFCIKDNCLALQFHPEVTKEGLELWYIGHVNEIESTPGLKVGQMRENANKYADQLNEHAKLFWKDVLIKMNLLDKKNMIKQINNFREYKLLKNKSDNKITLLVQNKPTISANFYFDKPGRCVLLSGFHFVESDYTKLDLFALLEVLHKYIQNNNYIKKHGGKFICLVNKDYSQVLLAFEFRNKQVERLMMRSEKSSFENNNLKTNSNKVIVINNKQDLIESKAALTRLVSDNAYWLNECHDNEMENRIKKAHHVFALAIEEKEKRSYIGFIRVIDDGLLQYISDMVISSEYQNKGYGKYLFSQVCEKVLSESGKIPILVRAEKGPGLIPAQKIYGKFGFIESNEINHQINGQVINFKEMPKVSEALLLAQSLNSIISSSNKSTSEKAHVSVINEPTTKLGVSNKHN